MFLFECPETISEMGAFPFSNLPKTKLCLPQGSDLG